MKALPRIVAITLITLLAGAQAAQWAGKDAPELQHGMHGSEIMDAGGMMHGLMKMKAELKLDAAQTAKWDEAETAAKSLHDNMRQEHDKIRALLDAEKQKDIIDLAKLDSAMQAQREQRRAAHEAVHAKWLAVYASLNDDQKKLVTKHIKEHMSKLDKMRDHLMERMHHGEPPRG